MAKEKLLSKMGGTTKSFLSEDGNHYRHFRTDMDPVVEHVKYMNEKVNEATRAENKQGYHYIGSVPITMIDDWLRSHGYDWNDFATNAGGEKGKTDPQGPGVKDQFMRYFLSRDFAKLHTQHATTKKDSGLIFTGD